MKRPKFLEIDPGLLRLPITRLNGADLVKLQRQMTQYGASKDIPPILVYQGSDGG